MVFLELGLGGRWGFLYPRYMYPCTVSLHVNVGSPHETHISSIQTYATTPQTYATAKRRCECNKRHHSTKAPSLGPVAPFLVRVLVRPPPSCIPVQGYLVFKNPTSVM